MIPATCRRAALIHFAPSSTGQLTCLSASAAYSTASSTSTVEDASDSGEIEVSKGLRLPHRRRLRTTAPAGDSVADLLTKYLTEKKAASEVLDSKAAQREEPHSSSVKPQRDHALGGLISESWVQEKWSDDLVPATEPLLKPNTSAVQSKRKQRIKKKRGFKDPPPHGAFAEREVEGMLAPANETLRDIVPSHPRPPIPRLAHGLDRVLFNPGVHWVQDPRSRVYNFTPWLENVPKVSEFDFDRLPGFVPSSRDQDLRTLAKREGKRFAGSTSSLSGILSQCYFLISETKEVDTSSLSLAFKNQPKTFSPGQRWPASVILNYADGVYTVDSDKSKADLPEKTILIWLGTLLESHLTLPPDQFRKLLKSTPPPPNIQPIQSKKEAYRYAKSKDFVMRSQLDCYDPRLPGSGVFDIKTRACVATRLDILNYEEHTGYTIKRQHGLVESFEKEYYDLIRSAFLKYSFQVRIGNMDGVIVAYHNTDRIFGFQYIPLSEMDACLYGSSEAGVGDRVFDKCIGLMEKVMNEVVGCFQSQSVQVTFETKEDTKGMHVWVEPLKWDGPEHGRPIEQLRVEVTSYLEEDPVKGLMAAISADGTWTMRYNIKRLTLTPETKRKNLASARGRQNPAFLIPSHVAANELEAYWHSLSHGGKKGDDVKKPEFDPSMFMQPPPAIERLRMLSRKGKEESEKQLELYGDEPKIVWGAGHAPK